MRLIDADAFTEQYGNYYAEEGPEEGFIGTVGELIAKQPTIEPEVRHGRIIEGRYPNENKCSECGQIFRDDIQFIYPYDENSICKTPKRCPECGCYWEGDADNG